jgi:hypothetical protein
MLHAFTRGKSSLHLTRYLGSKKFDESFDEATQRNTAEDEITSIVFTPLALMPEEWIARFWHKLLLAKVANKAMIPSALPTAAKMYFWDKRTSLSTHVGWCADRDSIEPELCIKINYPHSNTSLTIIVEFKWNAGLHPCRAKNAWGKDQLDLQWDCYLTQSERDNGFHIYIGKNKLANSYLHEERLVQITWVDLLGVMNNIAQTEPNLSTWIGLVNDFMDALNIYPFGGFQFLDQVDVQSHGCALFFQVQA